MIATEKKQEIQRQLKALAEANTIAVRQAEQAIKLITLTLELSEPQDGATSESQHVPFVDWATFTIRWKGRSCFLGNTLLFAFFARIHSSMNTYVSHVDLLEDVWRSERNPASIRGVVKRLRDRLRESGMQKLAARIDGSVSGFYGLMLV